VRSQEPAAGALATIADLESAIEDAVKRPLSSEPAPDLEVDFDDVASPWHTICEVRGQDRHGLLHTVAVGFASSEVSVHSARVETKGGIAIERFEVTDTEGRKLDGAHERAARDAIWSGTEGASSAFAGLTRLFRR
jgi:[protein-PII] uridylyltransferase